MRDGGSVWIENQFILAGKSFTVFAIAPLFFGQLGGGGGLLGGTGFAIAYPQ